MYVPQSLCRRVLDWYHFYLNHLGGSRLAKTVQEFCYCKSLVTQAHLLTKTWKNCQQFKERKNIYGHMPPNNIAGLKPWDLVHVDLIGPNSNSIRQQQTGGTIIWNNYSLNWMTIIDPSTGWFEIVEILTFEINEVTAGNDEYIDKSYSRVSQKFNNTWLCRYLRPRQVVFDNGYEFKQ